MKTYAIHTLGCKVNTYESEAISRLFEAHDYHKVSFKEIADVYIINTCTVTNTGDSKSRNMIRRAIKRNPDAVVAVVGCYSQVAPEEISSIEGVDIVLGTQFRNEIVDLCEQHMLSHQQITKVRNVLKEKEFEELNVDVFTENTRAFLKIEDGCNKFCTYCIIPYARGLVRSRKKEHVIEQAQQLVNNGFVEIVLTGIHTGAYGLDLENYDFDHLIEDMIKEVKGLKRLRISSIEVNQITDHMIDMIGKGHVIVDHLHIPIQSGCDTVLKRMNRKYTTQQYKDFVARLRKAVPDIALTTDVIVGFPQETEEEFEETVQFIKDVNFSELHVFPYSRRKGTPAAKMDGQVDERIKDQRVKTLIQLSEKMHQEYAKKFIGKTLEVIFEERFTDEYMTGHSGNYLKIIAKGNEDLIGKITKVQITSVNSFGIEGIVL